MAPTEPVYFQTELRPHRSLTAGQFRLLMAIIGGASALVGGIFMLVGAWPVLGFCGLEVLAVYGVFRWNFRDARRCERLELTRSQLMVRRIEPDQGDRCWRFQPYWLRVSIDDPVRPDSELALTSHGQRFVIGSFLHSDQRAQLADALRRALADCRSAVG